MNNKQEHEHHRPTPQDFEGKTVSRFECDADNCWRIWFTDGTAFAIQSDLHYGLAVMDICRFDVCVNPVRR